MDEMGDEHLIDQEIRRRASSALLGVQAAITTEGPTQVLGDVRSRVHGRAKRRRLVRVAAVSGILATLITSAVVVGHDDGKSGVVASNGATNGSRERVVENVGGDIPLAPRGNVALAAVDGGLFLWGGDHDNLGFGDSDVFSDGAIYRRSVKRWSRLPSAPMTASAAKPVAVTASPGVVVLARGTSTALWLDGESRWQEASTAPRAVDDLTVGGRHVYSYSAGATFDIDSRAWTPVPPPPQELSRPVVAWTGTEFVVVGGPGTPFAHVEAMAFDPVDRTWRTLPPWMQFNAAALAALGDDGQVVVVNYDLQSARFDLETNSWSRLGEVPARSAEWIPTLLPAIGGPVVVMFDGLYQLDGESWRVFDERPPRESADGRVEIPTTGDWLSTGDTFWRAGLADRQFRIEMLRTSDG
jgi:hypothetical protein